MFYPSYATLAIAALLSMQSVLAAPMPMEAKIGDGEHKGKIVETMPVVNQKLKNMKAVINLPDAQAKAHPATVKAFGKNANVGEIRKKIDNMDKSKIMIPSSDAEPGLTQGGTWPNGHIKFGSAFYSSDKNTRAGTILHEAAHAKNGAVDHFKADGTPGKKGDPIVGYKDSHMDQLNAKHSDQTHHNADAYRVFGDECPHVARRALEESHPVVRRALLRRAAKACAWKPKSKGAAAKANTKAAAKSKAHGSQKSVDAKKPLKAVKAAKAAHAPKAASKSVQHAAKAHKASKVHKASVPKAHKASIPKAHKASVPKVHKASVPKVHKVTPAKAHKAAPAVAKAHKAAAPAKAHKAAAPAKAAGKAPAKAAVKGKKK